MLSLIIGRKCVATFRSYAAAYKFVERNVAERVNFRLDPIDMRDRIARPILKNAAPRVRATMPSFDIDIGTY